MLFDTKELSFQQLDQLNKELGLIDEDLRRVEVGLVLCDNLMVC